METYTYKGNLIILLPVELDHHYAQQIREKAISCIRSGGITNVIFDFTNTVFMDSSGIGAIMGRYREMQALGGRTAVTGLNKSTLRIFMISGLYKIVEKYESIDDAIKSMQEGS